MGEMLKGQSLAERELGWVYSLSGTLQISDPTPLIADCQPERHRRVR
jgi:hypothetical protein